MNASIARLRVRVREIRDEFAAGRTALARQGGTVDVDAMIQGLRADLAEAGVSSRA